MVKVKCKLCKNAIDKNEAYVHIELEKKRNSYFCNENHSKEYFKVQEQKELEKKEKQRFTELDIYIASEILLYDIGQITPRFLKRRIKQLAKHYDYDVIRTCFELKKQELNYYVKTKEFVDENHMTNYIMVVIENNINDVYKNWKRKQEIESQQKKMEDILIDEVIVPVNMKIKQNTNDISMFLTEDDL